MTRCVRMLAGMTCDGCLCAPSCVARRSRRSEARIAPSCCSTPSDDLVLMFFRTIFSRNSCKKMFFGALIAKRPAATTTGRFYPRTSEKEKIKECANSTGAVAPAQPEGVKNASSIRPHVLRDSAGRLRRAVLRQPPHYGTLSANRQPLTNPCVNCGQEGGGA